MDVTDAEEKFHNHLDVCQRCREEVFNLCPVGLRLIHEAGAASGEAMLVGLGQWNKVINKS
jgi:hypothetical protein